MSLTEKTVKECLPGKLTTRKQKIPRQHFMHNITSKLMKKKCNIIKNSEKSLKRAIAPLLVKYRIVHSTLAAFLGIKNGIRKQIPVAKSLSGIKKMQVESLF